MTENDLNMWADLHVRGQNTCPFRDSFVIFFQSDKKPDDCVF
jgi:hypothetical protein